MTAICSCEIIWVVGDQTLVSVLEMRARCWLYTVLALWGQTHNWEIVRERNFVPLHRTLILSIRHDFHGDGKNFYVFLGFHCKGLIWLVGSKFLMWVDYHGQSQYSQFSVITFDLLSTAASPAYSTYRHMLSWQRHKSFTAFFKCKACVFFFCKLPHSMFAPLTTNNMECSVSQWTRLRNHQPLDTVLCGRKACCSGCVCRSKMGWTRGRWWSNP